MPVRVASSDRILKDEKALVGPVQKIKPDFDQAGLKSLSEKGSDPLEASHSCFIFSLAREGQTPFPIGFKPVNDVLRGSLLQNYRFDDLKILRCKYVSTELFEHEAATAFT